MPGVGAGRAGEPLQRAERAPSLVHPATDRSEAGPEWRSTDGIRLADPALKASTTFPPASKQPVPDEVRELVEENMRRDAEQDERIRVRMRRS